LVLAVAGVGVLVARCMASDMTVMWDVKGIACYSMIWALRRK
jgi:hypothetical protein